MLDRPFTEAELIDATDALSTIPGWREGMRAAVMDEFRRMVPHHRALKWLVGVAVARCRTWPGLAELRGLLCTRFDAADGVDEPNCSIPGFTEDNTEGNLLASCQEADVSKSTINTGKYACSSK